jgi:Beta-propeller repeat
VQRQELWRPHHGAAAREPTGGVLVYSAYLGGGGDDEDFGLAIDASGNVYVTGSTTSTNFPTTPGAHQGSQCIATDDPRLK